MSVTKIGTRLDFWGWELHAAQIRDRLGFKGRHKRGARSASTIENPAHQPSYGIVPVGEWENWATDLQIDQWREECVEPHRS